MSNSKFKHKASSQSSKKPELISYILEATASKETQQKMMDSTGAKCREIYCHIYKTHLGEKTFLVAWAGGKFVKEGEEVGLGLFGLAAFEALDLYPGSYPRMVLAHLKISDLPLRLQIIHILKGLPNNSRVCFFGDVSGELDGKLYKAFNVCDEEGNSLAIFDEQRLNLLRKNYSLS